MNAFSAVFCPSQEMALSIQQGHLVILSTGWIGHAINLVFYRGYMAICNRGEKVSHATCTIELFLINSARITEPLIRYIRSQVYEKRQNAMPYFYQELPKQLDKGVSEGVFDPLYDNMLRIAPKELHSGTCTYGAVSASLYASIFLLKTVTKGSQHYRSLASISKKEAESIVTFVCLDEMQSYLRDYSSPEDIRTRGDLSFVQRALLITYRAVQKEKNYIYIFDIPKRTQKLDFWRRQSSEIRRS